MKIKSVNLLCKVRRTKASQALHNLFFDAKKN